MARVGATKLLSHCSNASSLNLKQIKGKKLARLIHEALDQKENCGIELQNCLTRACAELQIRKNAKTDPELLRHFQNSISSSSSECSVGANYSMETAGIRKNSIDPTAPTDELIHPYARSHIAKQIIDEWEHSPHIISLERYIRHCVSDDDKKALLKRSVRYLSPEEHSQYEVTFANDGTIKIGSKRPPDGLYIFALSQDGKKLLAGEKKKGIFQHTSFFAGNSVQCAGKFEVLNGAIVSATLKSGHYKPTHPHGLSLRTYFKTHLGEAKAHQIRITTYDHIDIR